MAQQTSNRKVILPVYNTLILPGTSAFINIRDMSADLKAYLSKGGDGIALPVRSMPGEGREASFHHTGILFDTKNMRDVKGVTILEVNLKERVRVEDAGIDMDGALLSGEFTMDPDIRDIDEKMEEQMLGYLKQIVREVSEHFQGGKSYVKTLDGVKDINTMIVWLGRNMELSAEEKYAYLKTDSLRERSLNFMDALRAQKEAVDWNIELSERMSDKTNQYYREQMLRQQLKAIQQELGETGSGEDGGKDKDYAKRIEEAGLPEDVKKAAMEELGKLSVQQPGSSESGVIQNYLDFILALPWKKEEREGADLTKAREILDADHYGLDKVKKRIIEHLAVMKLKHDKKGSILLLVGPPGTGKTSLGKSIARALDRKYIRLSLGGIRDEAEIRGHRRTYVGAMAGRILGGMKQAGVTDPVMVLDEVDKLLAGGFSGDPASALLEVLDPEQNSTFTDHYLDLPYDLSDVFFIATANSTDTIPGPLLDRMEVIQVSSYTEDEKFHIAREHLLGQALEEAGLTPDQLLVPDETIRTAITDFTMEGGVRGLKKVLLSMARAVSAQIVTGQAVDLPKEILPEELEEMLGRKVSRHDAAGKDNPPGIVTGLAWTPAGGEILFIEAASMPGTGQIILTGQLGDVMKESARISLSLLKSRLPMSAVNFKEQDIHIHVPSGSTPKDGPSAGITIFTALASLFTGRKVDSALAMTGEITLRGVVMPIGGLKEKLLAAGRAGVTKALIPRENMADLRDIPQQVKEQIHIVPVDTIEDVLRETLGISLPRPETLLLSEGFLAAPEIRE